MTPSVSKVDSQGKKEEVPIQLVLVKKQKKGTSNDHNSQTKYKRRNRKWGEEKQQRLDNSALTRKP